MAPQTTSRRCYQLPRLQAHTGTTPLKEKPPPRVEGDWQLHPASFVGKTIDSTDKVNLTLKVFNFVELGSKSML